MDNFKDKDKAKKEAAPVKKAATCKTQNYNRVLPAKAQCRMLLAELRKRPLTTLEIRRDLDILGAAQRIMDLRDEGYQIITHWCWDITEAGVPHRVGRYVLLAEPANQQGKWHDLHEPLSHLPDTSFSISADQRERDLQNWKKALEKTNPAYAKQLINGRLRDLGAVDEAGAIWLIDALNLAEV
jgi:hypothetical protein